MRWSVLQRYLWRQDLSSFVPTRVVSSAGTHSSYIGGNTVVGGGRSIGIESPSDALTVTEMREADVSEVNDAVQYARRHASTAACVSMPDRARLLRNFATAIRQRAEVLAQADALSCGMCLADARVSVESSASCFETIAALLECSTLSATTPVPLDWSATHDSRTSWAPVGVVALLTPFNYPLEMFAWKVAPALAAGNTVVWKPPEAAPLSSFAVIDIVRELQQSSPWSSQHGGCGLQIVQGGPHVGAALASHMDVDLVAFTGSGGVGRLIQIAAARSNLKRVQLELGGNGCVVVGLSALEQRQYSREGDDGGTNSLTTYNDAIQIAMQCFSNSGQSCTSCRRVFVPRSHAVQFAKDVALAASKRKLGHALDPSVEQGPLISAAALDRALSAVQDASCLPGVSLVSGGFKPSFPAGHFMAPTVLLCSNPRATIVREELFAPVLCVIPYDGTSALDAVALANDSAYGLSAVVVSNDAAEIEACVARLAAGTVWVNCVDAMSAATPFGGWKQSGYGKDLGMASLEGYSNLKTTTMLKAQRRGVASV